MTQTITETSTPQLTRRYEDEWLLVLEKQAGWVMYDEHENASGERLSVAAFLRNHCGEALPTRGENYRRGIVHRLDKDTSGLLVVAKNNEAHDALQQQWQRGGIERHYVGFLYGALAASGGDMRDAIGRHFHDATRRAVQEDGKEARTIYRTEQIYGRDFPLASKVCFRLKTGRTHQIRVHCEHHHCPVVGDGLYGKSHEMRRVLHGVWRRRREELCAFSPYESVPSVPITRQALHARSLGFRHPGDGRVMRYEMEMPQDMCFLQAALEYLSEETANGG